MNTTQPTQSQIISQFSQYLSLGSTQSLQSSQYNTQYQSEQKSMSQNTIKGYIADLTMFFSYKDQNTTLLTPSYTSITREEIVSYLNHLQYTLKNKAQTVNHKLATIRKYNQFLIENKYQTEFVIYPSDTIVIQKSKFSPNTLTQEDVTSLLEVIKSNPNNIHPHINTRNYTIAYLLIYSGMRISEALALELTDLNLSDGEIIIRHGKENKQRTVMINKATIEVLKQYLCIRSKIADQSPYLFVSQKYSNNNGRIEHGTFSKVLKTYTSIPKRGRKSKLNNAKSNNSSKLTPHKLRHRFVTQCIEKGMPISVISEQVGHAHIQTTMIYTQINKNEFRQQLELL